MDVALAGDSEGVHRARVASRRLREVLPVVAGGTVASDDARRAVRRVTRALGPVREIDVATQLLAGLAADRCLGGAAHTAVRRQLAAARAAAMGTARSRLPMARRQHIVGAMDAVERAVLPPRAEVGAAVAARIARRGRALVATLDQLGTLYSATRLHAVRIAVKQLRYVLEVAGDLRLRPTAAERRLLRVAQDLLGQAHDLHVLAGLVRRHDAWAAARPAVANDVRRLLVEIERRCRVLHGKFLERRPAITRLARQLARPHVKRAAA